MDAGDEDGPTRRGGLRGAGPEGPPGRRGELGRPRGDLGVASPGWQRGFAVPVWASVHLPRQASGTTPLEGGRRPQAWSLLLSWAARTWTGRRSECPRVQRSFSGR